jgi:hypothetical protein
MVSSLLGFAGFCERRQKSAYRAPELFLDEAYQERIERRL